MSTRRSTIPIAHALLPALALVLGACVVRDPGYRDDGPDRRRQVVVAHHDPYPETYYVAEHSYPQRVHYHQSADTGNVYYFDERRPQVIVQRRTYRQKDGRTYYVEREGGADRRFYYDDDAARSRRHGRDRDGDEGRGHGRDGDHGDGRDRR